MNVECEGAVVMRQNVQQNVRQNLQQNVEQSAHRSAATALTASKHPQ